MWEAIYKEMTSSNNPLVPALVKGAVGLSEDVYIKLIIQISNIAMMPIIVHRQDVLDVIKDHPAFTTKEVENLPIEYSSDYKLVGWLYDIPVVLNEADNGNLT